MSTVRRTIQKITEAVKCQLEISGPAALRLGRLLERLAQELCSQGEASDCEFARAWAQVFTMYGRAVVAHLYMNEQNETNYNNDIALYKAQQ